MKKPFLVLKKVREWFTRNSPDRVLLAMLDDGTIPIRVVDDGVEQEVYLSFYDESDDNVFEIEVEMIDDLRFKAMIRHDYHDLNSQKYNRIFTQPEKDAWIEWRDV
jgi:hypothetical protein